jgi:hypothetical protein|uniref:Uncharacterized protein n=1 Tax=Eutreptiella gymnastica TaxID=73025 RepID=A0A7S4LLJ6_9EUGL
MGTDDKIITQDPSGQMMVGTPVQPEPAYANQALPPSYLMTPPQAFYNEGAPSAQGNGPPTSAPPPQYYYGKPEGHVDPPYAPQQSCVPNGIFEQPAQPTQPYVVNQEYTADFSCNHYKTTSQHYSGEKARVTHLNFYDNRVKKIEGLGQYPCLLRVTLKWNDLKSFEGLNDAQYLRWIDASGNLLKSMKGANTLWSLEWLDLHYNNIGTLRGLVSAPYLTWLNLNSNLLENLNGIEAIPKLRFLDASNNNLSSVVGLERCRELQEVNLATNYLESSSVNAILALADLPYLFRLNIHNNDLTANDIQKIQDHFQQVKPQCEVITDENGCRRVGHNWDVSPDIPKNWKPKKKCIIM